MQLWLEVLLPHRRLRSSDEALPHKTPLLPKKAVTSLIFMKTTVKNRNQTPKHERFINALHHRRILVVLVAFQPLPLTDKTMTRTNELQTKERTGNSQPNIYHNTHATLLPPQGMRTSAATNHPYVTSHPLPLPDKTMTRTNEEQTKEITRIQQNANDKTPATSLPTQRMRSSAANFPLGFPPENCIEL